MMWLCAIGVLCAVVNLGFCTDQYNQDGQRGRGRDEYGGDRYNDRDGDRHRSTEYGQDRRYDSYDREGQYGRNQGRYPSYDRGVEDQERLSVTAIEVEPYVRVIHHRERFEGIAVDVLKEMCRRVGCWYDIHIVRDRKYGDNNYGGSWDGMIGEVTNGVADLALGPLIITTKRRQAVDFTRQWMDNPLAVLVRRKTGLVTLDQLANQTYVRYGAISDSLPMKLIRGSSSRQLQRMWTKMQSNPQWMVDNEREGLRRVRDENYALIMERTRALHLASEDCQLRAFGKFLEVGQGFGFAMRKGDPRLSAMDRALDEMRRDGSIDEIKRRSLRNDCPYDYQLARVMSAAPAGGASVASVFTVAVALMFSYVRL